MQSFEKYIPKKLKPYLSSSSWVCKNSSYPYTTYVIDFDGLEDEDGNPTSFCAESIAELRWACSQILKGERGQIL